MRYIIFFVAFATLLACGQNETKQKELELKEKELALKEKELALDSAMKANTAKSTNPTDTKKETQQEKPKVITNSTGNEEFDIFFTDFKNAAASKNKSQITQMMSFPFNWNAVWQDQNTFLNTSYETDAVFEIKKAKKASKSNETSIGGSVGDMMGPQMTKKYNSMYVTELPGTIYYFAKVSGQYKLVCIITPG